MDKMTAVRSILLVLSWINTLLVYKGYNQLPVVGEEEVSLIVTLVVSFWAWWKNNYISKKGQAQKEILDKHGLK